MAYVLGYEYDLFISYAHVDDEGEGWVTHFTENLLRELRQSLGGTRDVTYFLDHASASGGNFEKKRILQAARSSAVFIAIKTNAYATREWTADELSAFNSGLGAGDKSRTFIIDAGLNRGELTKELNILLREHCEHEFFSEMRLTGLKRRLPATEPAYSEQMFTLAHAIARKMLELAKAAKAPATGKDVDRPIDLKAVAAGNRKRVLIARATDDLLGEAKAVGNFLRQYDGEVELISIPEEAVGEDFKSKFEQALTEADIFVQLLGPYAGFGNLQLFQFKAARSLHVRMKQWRALNVAVEEIADPEHKELVGGRDVEASTLEGFKQAILAEVRSQRSQARVSASMSIVVILAHQADKATATEICDESLRRSHSIVVPPIQLDSEENNESLCEELQSGNKFVFMYGQSSDFWFHKLWRIFLLNTKKDLSILSRTIFCYGPPPTKALSIKPQGARILDCRERWDLERIRTEIAGIVE